MKTARVCDRGVPEAFCLSQCLIRPAASLRPRRAGSRGRAPRPRPSGGAGVVVARDRVEQLGSDLVVQRRRRGPRSAAGRDGRGRAAGPPRSARNTGAAPSSTVRPTSWRSAAASEQVRAQARVELRGLAAERRHADRVLEQPARIGVVAVWRRRQRRAAASQSFVADEATRRPPAGLGGPPRRRGTPGSRPARRRRAGAPERASAGSAFGRSRANARRAEAGRGTARPGRAREPRRPRRTCRPAARRRSRRAPRSGRSGRRARARGTASPPSCAAAACARPRRRPRRRGPRRARRSRSPAESRLEHGWYAPARGPGQAVSRPPLRRARRPLEIARRASVRRHLAGRARAAPRRAARTTSST